MRFFPMMLIPVLFYNILAFGGFLFAGTPDGMTGLLAAGRDVPMFSGDVWRFTLGDLVLLVALVTLFIETVRATRTSNGEVYNHAFSVVIFIIALIEFLVLERFASSTFFFITAMCLFDVIAGYTISIITAKRDFSIAPPDAPIG